MQVLDDVVDRPALEQGGAPPIVVLQAGKQPVEFVGFGAEIDDLLQHCHAKPLPPALITTGVGTMFIQRVA